MTASLRVGVVSDLHVRHDASEESSWLSADAQPTETGRDLVADLRRLIAKERLEAQFLLCAGDMGDKATRHGIVRAWDIVQQIGGDLSANLVVGTVGNHDVASREPGDPTAALRHLFPPFPFASDAAVDANAAYWGQHFATYMLREDTRVLNINSAAHHQDVDSAKRGRLEPDTIRAIERRLESEPMAKFNILLLHHHPVRVGPIDLFDNSEMFGAQLLLDILQGGKYGSWLVIHGHKHVPRMHYYLGGNQALPILSAGSLGATLYPSSVGLAHNQFYVLELQEVDTVGGQLIEPVVTCRAWSWNPSFGWSVATWDSGIADGTGFGWRVPAADAAQVLADAYAASGERWLTHDELLEHEPRFSFLTPEDQKRVLERLSVDHQLTVVEEHGRPRHIGRT